MVRVRAPESLCFEFQLKQPDSKRARQVPSQRKSLQIDCAEHKPHVLNLYSRVFAWLLQQFIRKVFRFLTNYRYGGHLLT